MNEELAERDFTGATIDQAVDKACDYFNVTPANLSYEVTKSSTRGILRSKRSVTISAKPKKAERGNKRFSKPKETVTEQVGDEISKLAVEKTNEILEQLGLNLTAEKVDHNERFIINISGPDRMYLLNKDAEALEALQFLMNKMLSNNDGFTKLLLDSNGFRDQKEHNLVQLAHSMATKVKRQKRSVTLDPLNSYERRIIHMTLAKDNEVRTTSRGEGQLKRITISLSR